MKGIIKITDKVRFVYHELPELNIKNDKYWSDSGVVLTIEKRKKYKRDMKEYNASKREVEVSNVGETSKGKWVLLTGECGPNLKLEHNQPCEANVENGMALITKIL